MWNLSDSLSNCVEILRASVMTGSGIPASRAALNPKLFGQDPGRARELSNREYNRLKSVRYIILFTISRLRTDSWNFAVENSKLSRYKYQERVCKGMWCPVRPPHCCSCSSCDLTSPHLSLPAHLPACTLPQYILYCQYYWSFYINISKSLDIEIRDTNLAN